MAFMAKTRVLIKIKIFLVLILLSLSALADTNGVLKKGQDFFSWLESKESFFAACKIEKKEDQIQMCDGTQVSYSELKKFFEGPAQETLKAIKEKGVTIEVICAVDKVEGDFAKTECLSESTDKTFKKVSSLHGLYVADTNKIYIRSSATKGALIHEYLHFLQAKNTNKVDGHIYKTEKNELKKSINLELDRIEAEVKKAEQSKQSLVLKEKVAEFMKVNDLMLAFGKWQDLIDERSLFLLFVQFENDFKIQKADMNLVQKNLGFICNRKDYKSKLPECP